MEKLILFVSGCLVGGAVGALVMRGEQAPERVERTDALPAAALSSSQIEATEAYQVLRRERDELAATAEDMERDLAQARDQLAEALETMDEELDATPPEIAGTGPVTGEEIKAALDAFGQNFQEFLRTAGKEGADAWREFAKRGGNELVKNLIEAYSDESTDFSRRLLLAHALAQTGSVEGIEWLQNKIRDPDAGMFDKRLASHGLAFSDAEGIEPFLVEVARTSPDNGARANAAFGLARREQAEGYQLYMEATDAALEAGDPAGLQYLGGVYLLGNRVLPHVRKRLSRYEEPQALMMLIEYVKSKGDLESIPQLEKLAFDSSRPESVQQSAARALKTLREKQAGG